MAHYDCTKCGEAMGISPERCPACQLDAALVPSVEHTGGSSGYYRAFVEFPTTLPASYAAECNDIIESLDMTFAEGNVFKAVWRTATARKGKQKKGNNAKYDAEKMVFFAERILIANQEK